MKILVVDDDKTMRSLMLAALKKNDYNVFEAENGENALEEIQKNQFDLLILDYNMPDITGYDLLMKCKTQDIPLPPTIFVSAKSSAENVKNCISAGAKDFIVKPFEFQDLIARIKRHSEAVK